MDMAIAAMSVEMNSIQTQQALEISALKMAMAADNSTVEEALEIVESLDPALGQNIDIMA